jgi:hypothetical protein
MQTHAGRRTVLFNLLQIAMRIQARVEAGSNTSTVAWRVVGGDEKGITGPPCALGGYKYGDLALQVGGVSDLKQ